MFVGCPCIGNIRFKNHCRMSFKYIINPIWRMEHKWSCICACLFFDFSYFHLLKARSNGHNICYKITMPGHLSTFQEQKKCCDDIETKFKWIQSRHNMLQHLTTLLRGVVKQSQHRLSTNVVTNVVTVWSGLKFKSMLVSGKRTSLISYRD